MTREEIEKFSRIEPYCFETDREEDWYRIGCIDGMEAADANPDLSSLWHDVNEEPEGDYWRILCQDEMNGCWVENRVDAMLLHNTWNEYTATELLVKWAYINDLLPKTKEL